MNQMRERQERGAEIEGYAFTFCKAAFLALLLAKFTLLVTASVAVILYGVAYAMGVRQWRCFVKPPWVIVGLAAAALAQAYFQFWHHPALII